MPQEAEHFLKVVQDDKLEGISRYYYENIIIVISLNNNIKMKDITMKL